MTELFQTQRIDHLLRLVSMSAHQIVCITLRYFTDGSKLQIGYSFVRLQQSDRSRGHRVPVVLLWSSESSSFRIDPMTYKMRGHESVIVGVLPMFNFFHPSTTLHTCDICHVTSDTRPSPFSACNIEYVGVAWGQG